MEYLACCVPVSSLRLDPSHRSELVSQLLFGELCTKVKEGEDHWIRIKCGYDGYEGWCQEGQFTPVAENIYTSGAKLLAGGWVNNLVFDGVEMSIPFGSQLPVFNNGHAGLGEHSLQYNGELCQPGAGNRDDSLLKTIAFKYLNTAYLWGGKSVFGTDCSGFSQSVFKFLDVPLLRDASQQAEQGEEIHSLQDTKCGDLGFFDNPEGRITHVGILLNPRKIIHASVKVRIDNLDESGIINVDTLERTHRLRVIKRYWP